MKAVCGTLPGHVCVKARESEVICWGEIADGAVFATKLAQWKWSVYVLRILLLLLVDNWYYCCLCTACAIATTGRPFTAMVFMYRI